MKRGRYTNLLPCVTHLICIPTEIVDSQISRYNLVVE